MFPVIPKKNSGHLLQHRVHPMELRIGSGSLRKISECSCCVCISRDRTPSSVSWMNGCPFGELAVSCPVCCCDCFEAYGGFMLFSGWGSCVGWE